MKKILTWMALAGIALLGLSACDKLKETAASALGADAANTSDNANANAAQKISLYIEGYNKLLGTFGFTDTYKKYVALDIAHKQASNDINFNKGWVDGALAKFNEAAAIPGGSTPEIDKAAAALIPPLKKVVAQLDDLNHYYETKAYKEDALAKGKAADATLLANFKATDEAMGKFANALEAHQETLALAELASLKTKGDLVAYHTASAMHDAKKLLALFKSDESLQEKATYQQGDTLLASLEKSLIAQREALKVEKAQGKSPDVDYELTESKLSAMLGKYRDLKASHKVNDFNGMIEKYNAAIENANSIDN